MSQDATAHQLPRRKLLLGVAGALIAAILIVFGAILPAELDVDPLGLGKLTGIIRLWAPAERTVNPNAGAFKRARMETIPLRSDVIEIPLGTGQTGFELEYKVRMKKDATMVYAWEVVGPAKADDLYYDFHAHTTPPPGEEMTVATFRQGRGLKQQGSLSAPFDGIQGWYFLTSADKPIVIRLKISGFYELIPPGETGNEKRIIANVPAAQAVAP
jgi:hypothetical protein